MTLTIPAHPSVGEALAFLDAHCCDAEADELVVDRAMGRLDRAGAARLLEVAARRVRPGGTLVVRDLSLAAAASLAADAAVDGEAVFVDRKSFWTPDQVEARLGPAFRPDTRRVTREGVFEVAYTRVA